MKSIISIIPIFRIMIKNKNKIIVIFFKVIRKTIPNNQQNYLHNLYKIIKITIKIFLLMKNWNNLN